MKKEAMIEVALLILAIAFSAIIHAPAEVQMSLFGGEAFRPFYNDALAFFHYSTFSKGLCQSPPDIWINKDLMGQVVCAGKPGYALPVRDFKITAPPLPTLWFALASFIAQGIAGGYTSQGYVPALYSIQAISSAIGIIAGYLLVRKALRRRRLYPLYLVTVIAYGIYYWDFITLPLFMWGLYLINKGEREKALLPLALAALSDFFWVFVILIYLVMIGGEALKGRAPVFALLGLSPLAVMIAINPQYYSWVMDRALTSGLNNSIYVLLTRFADSTSLARLAGGLWVSAIVILAALAPRQFNGQAATEYLALSSVILYIISKASLPQTLIVLVPLLAALYKDVDVTDRRAAPAARARSSSRPPISYMKNIGGYSTERKALLVAEVLNASFLPLFLYIGAIAEYLSQLGIRASTTWYSLDCPIQWAIQARNILLVFIAIALIRRSRALARALER